MDNLKKEQIKDRLIKIAAERWNLQESEVDANFDPLMSLLFDALASELEGVGNLIKDIQGNLLQELAGLMLPQALLNAKPASCIISAMPNEENGIINADSNLTTSVQIQKAGQAIQETELNFTPIGEFKLLKLQLGYLKIGGRYYAVNVDGRKALLHEGSGENMIQEICFTLQNPANINSLKGLQLFFDLKGHSEANNFYFSLQQATLVINGASVPFKNGYFNEEQFDVTLKDAITRGGSYSRKLQKEIAGIYNRQFISITDDNIPELSGTSIDMLGSAPEEIRKQLNAPNTIYCTLKLGRPFAMDIMERVQMGINAFPAANRKAEQINFKTDKWINIVPLQVAGSYLDIETIQSADGSSYQLHQSIEDKDLTEGEAIVRMARVGKRSSAEIRNTIQGLLETIKDESAYFSHISNDFIAVRLTEISKILNRLEDQVAMSNDEKSAFRYLLLKPRKQGDNLQISYWITNPTEAMYVKAGQVFRSSKHTITNNNATFSITAAAGGIETRSEYAQKQMLVRQLSSKGKIVSAEDIKLLCYELFGSELLHIEIDKKMLVLPGKDAGISRVITIDLIVAKNGFSESELKYLENKLRYDLDTNASFVFPIEINITLR